MSMIMNMVMNSFYNLKSPSSINSFWNFGSMLGIIFGFQFLTGIFLSFHYAPGAGAFLNIDHIMREINEGWFFRYLHATGASMFFFLMYLHIFRAFFYSSYKMKKVWYVGIIIFLCSILTAFLGYVLPWGQMSFWAATVITNLLSSVPIFGKVLVEWLWGGFSVSTHTLNRFYSFHFLFPFILLILIIMHLVFLHNVLSSNPLGIKSTMDLKDFHPFFTSKDFFWLSIMFGFFFLFSMFYPTLFMDPQNYITCNVMVTPVHIKPEWYFLPFYAVLRAVPNKLGGVILMIGMLLVLIPLSLTSEKSHFVHKILCTIAFVTLLLLFWIGGNPVVFPYDSLGKKIVLFYFLTMSGYFNLFSNQMGTKFFYSPSYSMFNSSLLIIFLLLTQVAPVSMPVSVGWEGVAEAVNVPMETPFCSTCCWILTGVLLTGVTATILMIVGITDGWF